MKHRKSNNGFVVWMTGLPGSGKTTIADELTQFYEELDIPTQTMDGDEIRLGLSADLGFSKEDRQEHARRVAFVSKLLARNGVAVTVALISPYRAFREHARKEIPDFIEVFVKTPLDVCIERDPKGLYKKALKGEITDLTGLQDPYEEPLNPELVIDTTRMTPNDAAGIIIDKLKELGYVQRFES
ncbi:MAG: adenylyl-sulfate kinase [Methanosarcinales archaeon]|nr:adenylyl-sulfate kinase [Methanosarcinales archaeon]